MMPPKYIPFFENGIYDYSRPCCKTCAVISNEDCLYLSVYTPNIDNKTKQHPVLVWANEYANLHGPDFFIDENLIVVTVSFRFSIFGFLNTEDDYAEGNMGAKDILMALKWLRENITIFNGDPNRVTIIGSGLASTPVASMLVSIAADDLFKRAIILDGSALSPADYRRNNLDVAHKLYRRLSRNFDVFNIKKLHKILNDTPSAGLLLASSNLYDSTEVRDTQRLINSFGCSLEISSKIPFMNKSPVNVYHEKNINNKVQVIFGYTTLTNLFKLKGIAKNRELLEYLNYNFQYLLPFEGGCNEYDSKRYRVIQKEILDFYFLNGTIGKRSLKRYAKYVSDQVLYPLLRQATLHNRSSHSDVYLYRFAFKGSLNIGWRSSVPNLEWTGATLGDETCYLFRCKSETDVYKSLKCNERHFIKKIVRLLANFVKHGNPTPNPRDDILDTLKWIPLGKTEKLQAMNFGRHLRMVSVPEEKRKHFWDRIMKEYFND
ncbi:juvenile hormone esterase-like [Vanessa cardui]|uniref:juvenile hormone esterase-like n=1 Tax=Vanessa cardui TaxID=171605 RepID=UPI001F134B07|nr:juvenile hormone esterase-like [Vanessa cardui]